MTDTWTNTLRAFTAEVPLWRQPAFTRSIAWQPKPHETSVCFTRVGLSRRATCAAAVFGDGRIQPYHSHEVKRPINDWTRSAVELFSRAYVATPPRDPITSVRTAHVATYAVVTDHACSRFCRLAAAAAFTAAPRRIPRCSFGLQERLQCTVAELAFRVSGREF